MHPRLLIPVLLFVAGVSLIGAAVAQGEAEVSLLLIFPVFSGSSGLFILGTVLILLSFVSGFAFMALGQAEAAGLELSKLAPAGRAAERERRTKYGGVVLVGPVPIAFGSDQKMALAMLVLGIVLAVVLLGVLLLLA